MNAEMGLATARLGEGLAADRTLVRSFVGVRGPHMLVQPRHVRVGCCTQAALEQLHLQVHAAVVASELVSPNEAHVAVLTSEGLDPQVPHHVGLVLPAGVERPAAVLAHKLLAAVLDQVLLQLGALNESGAALGAQVGLEARVLVHVHLVDVVVPEAGPALSAPEAVRLVAAPMHRQGRVALEVLAADAALEGQLPGVQAQVLVQQHDALQHPAALVAGERGGAPVVLLLVHQHPLLRRERLVALGAGKGVLPRVLLGVNL